LSDDALQYPLAMVQVTAPFHQNAMSQNSLTGGTSSFLIPPQKSQTALCGEQIPTTSAFVAHTIFLMLQTLSSSSLIPMIPRMYLFSLFFSLITFDRDKEKTVNFEYLIRSLLGRPDQPAVIILGHFSPQVYQAWGLTGPEHWHSVIANHYDVPHLSTKPLLYDDYLEDYESVRKKYYADPVLANPGGHTLLSDVLIAYFQSMTCQLWNVVTGGEYDPLTRSFKDKSGSGGLFGGIGLRKGVPEPNLGGGPAVKADNDDDSSSDSADTDRTKPRSPTTDPQLRIPPNFVSLSRSSSHRPNGDLDELSPHCVSANDLINPLPPSLFYGSGWQIYHPSASQTSSRHDDVEGGATAAHYFYSTLPLSRIRIPILVAHGDVGIYYMKENFAKRGGESEVECWVDDNYNGRRRLGNDSEGKGVQVT